MENNTDTTITLPGQNLSDEALVKMQQHRLIARTIKWGMICATAITVAVVKHNHTPEA